MRREAPATFFRRGGFHRTKESTFEGKDGEEVDRVRGEITVPRFCRLLYCTRE